MVLYTHYTVSENKNTPFRIYTDLPKVRVCSLTLGAGPRCKFPKEVFYFIYIFLCSLILSSTYQDICCVFLTFLTILSCFLYYRFVISVLAKDPASFMSFLCITAIQKAYCLASGYVFKWYKCCRCHTGGNLIFYRPKHRHIIEMRLIHVGKWMF